MALATNSTPGSIVLAGDLTGTANSPQLRITGVVPGSYTATNMAIDSKGRTVRAETGTFPALSGDLTGTFGATVLSTTTVTPGSFTFSNVTVDAKGRVTAASSTSTAFSFSGAISGTISSTTLNGTTVSPGSYTAVNLTVGADGRLTTAASGTSTLSGDVTGAFNSTALSSTGVSPAAYPNANITVNSKGRITAVTASSASMSGDLTGFPNTNALASTGVLAGAYEYTSFTVDTKGRITTARTSEATYTQKGVLSVLADSGISIAAGEVSITPANGAATLGFVGNPVSTNNINIAVAGSVDVGTNIAKLDTVGVYTKALGKSTQVISGTSLTPALNDYNHFVFNALASVPTINSPTGAVNGKRFSFTFNGLPLTGSGTTSTLPSTANWSGYAWNGTIGVAVGPAGTNYATTADSSAWTARTGAGGTEVIWNGSLFCVIGLTNSYTSTDGLSWTTGSTSMAAPVSIAWNGTSFVAINASTAYTSTDGLSWTSSALSFTNCRQVAWHNGYWYAVADGVSQGICRSTDGTTWNVVSSDTGYNAVASSGNRLTCIGNTTQGIKYTDDGSNWFTASNTVGDFDDLSWTGSYFISMINGTVWDGVMYSTDGVVWSQLYAVSGGYLTARASGGAYLVVLPNITTTTGYRTTVVVQSPSYSAFYKFSNTLPTSPTNVRVDCVYWGSNTYCTYL